MSIARVEFSRMVDRRQLREAPLELVADEAERAALTRRLGLVAIERLEATIALHAEGAEVAASGELRAAIVQSCAVSGDDLAVTIAEPLTFRFVPASALADTDEEIELDESDLDEIAYEGTAFDLGEAVAQSLALAIDPYAVGPRAERVRDTHGLTGSDPAGPLQAALGKALRRK